MNNGIEDFRRIETTLIGLALFYGNEAYKDVSIDWFHEQDTKKILYALQNCNDIVESVKITFSGEAYLLEECKNNAQSSLDFFDPSYEIEVLKESYKQNLRSEILANLFRADNPLEQKKLYTELGKLLFSENKDNVLFVDLSKPCPPIDCLLDLDGIGFIARKEICTIKAKAKNGKTHLCAILAAALTGPGRCLGVTRKGTPKKVLFVDTEQGIHSSEYITKQIHKLNRWNQDSNNELLQVANVRLIDSKDRFNQIESIVATGNYDALIIDGVKDLTTDINDPKEATRTLDSLMKLIEVYNIALITVIHENKHKDSSDMRGHLGTELLNKSYEVFEVKKDVSFTVSCSDRRGKYIPDWAFTFNEKDELVIAFPDSSKEKQPKKMEKNMNLVRKYCKELNSVSMRHTDIVNTLVANCEISEKTAKNWIDIACQNDILFKNKSGTYSLYTGEIPSIKFNE